MKRKVLREVFNCERELTYLTDVSRKVVPDKRSLNRECLVTSALSFRLALVREFVCFVFLVSTGPESSRSVQRPDDGYGGRVPSKKRGVMMT